jgi:hypothetical protein
MNMIALNESSPEKAGVGGSIPSLATTFSNTYRHRIPGFGSNWFQYHPADTVSYKLLRAFDHTSPATSLIEVVRRIIHCVCIFGRFHSTATREAVLAAKKAK